MVPGLELLADKEYLGRMIIMGVDPSEKYDVVTYALSGRSPPSMARRLIPEGDGIKIEVTDPEQLKKGDPALLVYNVILNANKELTPGLVVSNGAQTDLVYDTWTHGGRECMTLSGVFETAFRNPCVKTYKKADGEQVDIDIASFEPDSPNFTPRITGIVRAGYDPVLAILRKIDMGDVPELELHRVRVNPGYGKFLSTYTGQNVPKGVKIPSFTGAPWTVAIPQESPEQLATALFDVLGPKTGPQYVSPGDDFRVSVVAAFRNRENGKTDYHMVNRF